MPFSIGSGRSSISVATPPSSSALSPRSGPCSSVFRGITLRTFGERQRKPPGCPEPFHIALACERHHRGLHVGGEPSRIFDTLTAEHVPANRLRQRFRTVGQRHVIGR